MARDSRKRKFGQREAKTRGLEPKKRGRGRRRKYENKEARRIAQEIYKKAPKRERRFFEREDSSGRTEAMLFGAESYLNQIDELMKQLDENIDNARKTYSYEYLNAAKDNIHTLVSLTPDSPVPVGVLKGKRKRTPYSRPRLSSREERDIRVRKATELYEPEDYESRKEWEARKEADRIRSMDELAPDREEWRKRLRRVFREKRAIAERERIAFEEQKARKVDRAWEEHERE